MANDWYGRAQLALQKGNEELAREALSRRQQQVDKAGGLKNQVETQAAAIDKLYESMQELESRILEARAKKDQMIARARTAKSTQEVNDMLTGLTGRSSMDAFTKMEEKVESLEAAAEISSDMAMRGDMALPGSSSLDKEFKLLESSSSVDDELKKMKGLLKASADPKTPRAPSPTSGIVDDEMEKLRQDAGL